MWSQFIQSSDPSVMASRIGLFIAILFSLMLWSIVWKGWALWRAARNGHQGWFIALLIINTLGILEIAYIFGFSELKSSEKK